MNDRKTLIKRAASILNVVNALYVLSFVAGIVICLAMIWGDLIFWLKVLLTDALVVFIFYVGSEVIGRWHKELVKEGDTNKQP